MMLTMSIENENKFIERMKSDDAFRERIMSIENVSARINAIHSEGYNIAKNKSPKLDFCFYQEIGILNWCGLDPYCAHFSINN
jgi:predicted ribosomally synthesized peptide with nif11-like leader